ncbi:S-type pyocin domain-containing protein [Serratia fonticola]|uniref:S-type pyocin domain-containing protein n=1 Tax=Serratia fonticola TaxID=47917 RepID=A0AAW3WVL1_SERFO|nr:S-type pyocin domain-containing protein [Serratia fonticola]MBC3214779.1 S-type pyocin domain-containing protein [Serratia fonticola]NYA15828.1 S-type pyocin domain-containing protein [Serratia fonticola]NYA35700.1 S-type pyocin domain-containing protein [Serratia fonticola]
MSGNGGDNAHNNQFGGGGRGPTGGVNTGSGSSNGNSGDRGYGYWQLDPGKPTPTTYGPDGQVRIEINSGMNWVSDNSIHWSDGKGGSGNDNVRTNVTAKVDNGYRAAVDGYIYTVTVNGNNAITGVYLYSRPTTPSRQNWAQTESARMTQARALVQAQLNALNAKKLADEKAAAEAKRKADEEAKRKQDEWDAAHPIEAAERKINEAQQRINQAQSDKTSAEQGLSVKTAQLNALKNEIAGLKSQAATSYAKMEAITKVHGPIFTIKDWNAYDAALTYLGQYNTATSELANKEPQVGPLTNEVNALQNALNNANARLAQANKDKADAQNRLNTLKQEKQAQLDAEARRQKEANEAKVAAEAKAKAEAEAATKAAAKEAAMSKLEQPNVFGMSGFPAAMAASAAPITFAETGLGSLALDGAVATTAWASVRTAIADLIGVVIKGSGWGTVIASIAYIPSAGEGSDKVPGRDNTNMFMSAMPADAIKLPDAKTLNAAAAAKGTVDLAVRGRVFFSENTFKTYLVRTTTPTPVRVVQAVRDEVTGLYGYTIPAEGELPSRTILVSPDKTPGYKGLPPLVTPQQGKATPGNTGNQSPVVAKPIIESFPMADDLDFRDIILVFPAETGMGSLYIMLQSGRDLPGKVEGKGTSVTGTWLAGAGKDLGSAIPSQIADNLRGKEFDSFDKFREAFWMEVAKDPTLAKQFNPGSLATMRKGRAPYARKSEHAGKRVKIELHHVKPISEGGAVYNVDNINAITPKRHTEIHSKNGGK